MPTFFRQSNTESVFDCTRITPYPRNHPQYNICLSPYVLVIHTLISLLAKNFIKKSRKITRYTMNISMYCFKHFLFLIITIPNNDNIITGFNTHAALNLSNIKSLQIGDVKKYASSMVSIVGCFILIFILSSPTVFNNHIHDLITVVNVIFVFQF